MQIAPTDFWLVWFQHLDHTQHMCCLLHKSSRCTSVLNPVMWLHEKIIINGGQDQQDIYHGRLAECFQWSFPNSIILIFDLNVVLPCVVRICQNGSFLSCISDLRLWFASKAVWVARSWEPLIRRRDLQGMCCFWDSSRCCLWLLMLILLRLISSHIVSLYFVYLIVSFHDVEECILFDFKFLFWQVEVKELGGTSLCSTRPRVHSSCNRCYWSQGAGQNGQIQKIQNKDEKGNCYSLIFFVHVCCNVEDWCF